MLAVLRTHAADPESEISKRRPLKKGKCTLMVDDKHEDRSAVLVLLDEQGHVLAKKINIGRGRVNGTGCTGSKGR